MSILFDGNSLIPAPVVDMRKEFEKTGDGTLVGTKWTITVNGTLVASKGSPKSDKTFWTSSGYPPDETLTTAEMNNALLRKQEAMRTLFSSSNNGKLFEIQPVDGSAPVKFNPKINDIAFTRHGQDQWVQMMDYTISMETDKVYVAGAGAEDAVSADAISNASEEWTLEAADEYGRTYRLTHRISAVGKRSYDTSGNLTAEAWVNAQTYVLAKMGLDSAKLVATNVLGLNSFSAYNYFRSQNLNEFTGEFSVSETWLAYDGGSAVEDFTVETRTSVDGGNLTSVVVQGTVTGLEVRNNTTHTLTSTRYDNASSAFTTILGNLHSRAQTYSGATLNSTPLNTVVGKNPNTGVITYSYEYNNRPTSLIDGATSEVITLEYNNSTDVVAIIPILGRALGPVIQLIGTVTPASKTLRIEAVMNAETNTYSPTAPATDAIALLYIPSATTVIKTQDSEQWSPRTGRYSRQVTWTYQ